MGTLKNFRMPRELRRRMSLRASFVAYMAAALACAAAFTLVTLLGISRGYQAVYDESYGPRPGYVYNVKTGTLIPALNEDVSLSEECFAPVYLPDLSGAAREVAIEDLRPAPHGDGAFSVQGALDLPEIDWLRMPEMAGDGNRQAMDEYYDANWESFVRWLAENPGDPEVLSYREALGGMPRSATEARAMFSATFGNELAAPFDFFFTSMYTEEDLAVLKVLDLLAMMLPLLWCAVCFLVAGNWFYRRRLAQPVELLEDAADRIAQENLDFTVTYESDDEMGRLAQSFETMRSSLEASQRQLWETAEERKRLNAAFAHDLRTPLMVLRGRVELLAQQAEDDALSPGIVRATSATLLSQVERLEQYVETMGALQRLEDRAVIPKSVSLGQVTNELSELAALLADQSGKSVEVVAEEAVPAGLSGETNVLLDVPLVMEVTENLLTNALRFATANVRVRLQVRPAAGADDDAVAASDNNGADDAEAGFADNPASAFVLTITVVDDGPGFSPEALAHACDPFYSCSRNSAHLGVGLAIAKALCELHNGTLAIANRPEGGASVIAAFAQLL